MVLGLAPFGSFQAGWLAEKFGVRVAFAFGGLVCLAVAVGVSWWMARAVRVRRGKRGARERGKELATADPQESRYIQP
jgi:hypothetical protein